MGLIQELTDFFGKFSFYRVVYEYEQGLYFRNGRSREVKARLSKEDLDKIIPIENEILKQLGGPIACFFKRHQLPKGFRTNFFGRPLHPDRFRKVLSQGIYFFIPLIDDIVKESKQEKVLNLGNISVPTIDSDSKVIMISCNIRYEMFNFYRAYIVVDDYEASMKDHTLSILAYYSRGKRFEQWKDPKTIEELERLTLDELRKIVTEKWGIKIHKIYITDHVPCSIQRVAYEGASPYPTSLTVSNPTEE